MTEPTATARISTDRDELDVAMIPALLANESAWARRIDLVPGGKSAATRRGCGG